MAGSPTYNSSVVGLGGEDPQRLSSQLCHQQLSCSITALIKSSSFALFPGSKHVWGVNTYVHKARHLFKLSEPCSKPDLTAFCSTAVGLACPQAHPAHHLPALLDLLSAYLLSHSGHTSPLVTLPRTGNYLMAVPPDVHACLDYHLFCFLFLFFQEKAWLSWNL